jgi:hypothetical protein
MFTNRENKELSKYLTEVGNLKDLHGMEYRNELIRLGEIAEEKGEEYQEIMDSYCRLEAQKINGEFKKLSELEKIIKKEGEDLTQENTQNYSINPFYEEIEPEKNRGKKKFTIITIEKNKTYHLAYCGWAE